MTNNQAQKIENAYNELEKAISKFIDVYYEDIQAGLKEVQEDETAPQNIIGMFAESVFVEQIQKKAMYQELKEICDIIYTSKTDAEANEKLKKFEIVAYRM